jgi:hypothetical protein
MKDFFTDMNPTLRGFLIIAAIVLAIVFIEPVALTFGIFLLILQILFVVAICYLVYRWWREHREEINVWSTRARLTFIVAFWVIVAESLLMPPIGSLLFGFYLAGLSLLAWVLGIAICGYAMWRVWTDEHTYGDYY